jgi:GNAT superfamily N-acetyltransferase
MEGDSLMQYKDYTIVAVRNTDADFYRHVGPFFGKRAVIKALGMPMYDDDEKRWLLVLTSNGTCIAVSSYIVRGTRGYLKSSYVLPDFRGQGIFNALFAERLRLLKGAHVTRITGTATEMSKNTYLRYGFTNDLMRGKYYSMVWEERG